MNILFCSVPFRPSVGGIETVSELLADRFRRQGHTVVLVTRTAADADDGEAFRIVRRPGARRLLGLVRWADVVFHNNISLRLAWPQLMVRRPWVVAHHTWIPRTGLAGRIKRLALRGARHIAISHAIAADLPVPSTLVPNPFAETLFHPLAGVARTGELVFVGRLVSDKGVDRLLEALAVLAGRGRRYRLSVIGDGPEAPALRAQAQSLGIAGQVEFVGRRVGDALVAALNAHRVLVVPSVWEEPFGIVVLEGLACGCVPVVTRSGGLPDAVGDCGLVVARDDLAALADGIASLVDDDARLAAFRARAAAHLARHAPDRVAGEYLQVIEDARRSQRR